MPDTTMLRKAADKIITQVMLFAIILVMVPPPLILAAEKEQRHDVVVVGAGIAGLSATWELAQKGFDVAVIEMQPLYGGTATMSEGALCIVGTPEQANAGIIDSPQIAFNDFMTYGSDPNGPGPDVEWVRYYTNESRREIYDWLVGLDVRFEKSPVLMPGNSVPRWHKVIGKGRGLVDPIYRGCTQNSRVKFFYGHKALSLIRDKSGRISGIRTQRLKDKVAVDYLAPVVILATGGFQGNMKMVRSYWSDKQPLPEKILVGAGINATGSGHDMARAVGARLLNMQYQWNYSTGLHSPSDITGSRGLNAFSQQSIWVNRAGRRFVNESQDTKTTFPELMKQPGGTYWAVFDSAARSSFFISGWSRESIEEGLFNNPQSSQFVKSAPTIAELAAAAGLPPQTLTETVNRWNAMITAGNDVDFGRIGCCRTPWSNPSRIERAPFYAVQFYPLARKSMGGVSIDGSCRVLDESGGRIPGLYAAGELTGLAGVNGKASLEGTFLGASILTGRVAGRAAAAELADKTKP
ncbi:FAD-dependent oxidoreductase [Geomonas agri]|uniref:FAD-dependent oxidoreductase n=1 Tax=Geomonas agri TaxID=2873702 RepID=UPI001CD38628|nr:FAD-dependent oxidoreductase [Geomonas agri]